MRRRADAGIDDQRHRREVLPERLQRIGVGEPAAGADRRAPRHQHLAARRDQPLGGNQVLGGVGEHLEAVLGERRGRFDQAEQVGLQRVVVADHLELDPVRAEQLARHLRGGDRLLGRAAAGRVGHDAQAERLDQLEEALARSGPGALAAYGDGHDRGARGLDGARHHLRRGIAGRADEQPRGDLGAVKRERLAAAGFNRVHGPIPSIAALSLSQPAKSRLCPQL